MSDNLKASLDRLKHYETELPALDLSMRAHVLAAWKEQILEDCAQLLRATDDPEALSNVDRANTISTDIVAAHEQPEPKKGR